jgi:AAA domain
MARSKSAKRPKSSLEERFQFRGDAVAPADRAALRSAIFEVVEADSGAERCLKLWQKTGTPLDDDLKQLWLHEMRQVQRLMSYVGAREVIVDVLEFVEDAENFGIILERMGQPLKVKRQRVSRNHWLRTLSSIRARALLWRNFRRVVTALGIIHAQGLIHGRISSDVIMSEGTDEPDFQLSGLEWSFWLGADLAQNSHAAVSPLSSVKRAESYSFQEDWRALGLAIAECLDITVKPSGDVEPMGRNEYPVLLNVSERVLLKRLIAPSRTDQLDAISIGRSIDDLVASIARSVSTRAGTFVMTFDRRTNLGEAVYDATGGEIAVDEHQQQIRWVQGDVDSGATLLVPRTFDPATSSVRLVTDAMVYRLRDDGAAVWDIAVCQSAKPRTDIFSFGDSQEHAVVQPILSVGSPAKAQEARARLGPDALDWSAFAGPARDQGARTETDRIRRALLLLQSVEALVKSLEVYPVEILESRRREGRRLVILRAAPDNDRDKIAKRVGLTESAVALKRLFEDEHRDAEAKWRISQAQSLGATRTNDVVAGFVDVVDDRGRRGYQFEVEEELPTDGPLFLRTERDIGTEQVIARRFRNIKALDTRVDLAEMLADPWRVRRSSREDLSEEEQHDAAFVDLDRSKQQALLGLWRTLPSFSVVGPPGVGKTRLATEVVRRRFVANRSSRILVSAQGHDALDNLQEKITEALADVELTDVLLVRSTTLERRTKSDEEVQRVVLNHLTSLSESTLAGDAPAAMRGRIRELIEGAGRMERERNNLNRDLRSGLGALSNQVLDAANIVISTANSADVERMVEAREQFDWVIVEEAAKGTGPELIGPLMLSGRRLLIGDHHQLPPFDADRLVKILRDHSLVSEAVAAARQLVAPLFRDGELEELDLIAADAPGLGALADMALRLLEPFRTLVEDDERRASSNPHHRPIAATLTEQRRMDPAIAEVISQAFYGGRLSTNAERAREAEKDDPPVTHLGAFPGSPIVVVDFPHVSSTGHADAMERSRPRWHNPAEVDAVVNVLRHLRPRDPAKPPTLAILSPYNAQVDKLHERITSLQSRDLQHLEQFRPVRSGSSLVGTVDSFQGSEADVVVLSLVRNNPHTGGAALGFLRDRRRMNVALSRAKSQLVLVGSLSFLEEAVRGVNPDSESHDLSFLTTLLTAIRDLANRRRNEVPLAALIAPTALAGN